jgi:hypothetical protein
VADTGLFGQMLKEMMKVQKPAASRTRGLTREPVALTTSSSEASRHQDQDPTLADGTVGPVMGGILTPASTWPRDLARRSVSGNGSGTLRRNVDVVCGATACSTGESGLGRPRFAPLADFGVRSDDFLALVHILGCLRRHRSRPMVDIRSRLAHRPRLGGDRDLAVVSSPEAG